MHTGIVVIVTESQLLEDVLTHTFETAGYTVLNLEDGAELYDYITLLVNHSGHRTPAIIVADASVPGPKVLDVCAWARLNNLHMPFIVLTEQGESMQRTAEALEGVTVSGIASPEELARKLAA